MGYKESESVGVRCVDECNMVVKGVHTRSVSVECVGCGGVIGV